MAAQDLAWPAFRVALSFTDAELDTYQKVVSQPRCKASAWYWWLACVAVGVVPGLLTVWLLISVGAVTTDNAGYAGLLVTGIFFLGLYAPRLLAGQSRRRRYYDSFRSRWEGAIMLVTPRGLTFRIPFARAAYARGAIKRATLEQGLVLLWVSTTAPLAIPARLLSDEQRRRMLSLPPEPDAAAQPG